MKMRTVVPFLRTIDAWSGWMTIGRACARVLARSISNSMGVMVVLNDKQHIYIHADVDMT
jgi:hypothetical protein